MNVTVTGRLLNNAVFEPQTDETYGKTSYSALLLLDPGQEDKILEARDAACKETFGDKVPANLNDWTLREGDDEDFESTFEKHFINPKSPNKPRALTRENGEIRDVSPEEGLIYAGARVAVSVSVYAYKKNPSKKIPAGASIGLRAVLFQKHDEPLSKSVAKDSEFDNFDSDSTVDLD